MLRKNHLLISLWLKKKIEKYVFQTIFGIFDIHFILKYLQEKIYKKSKSIHISILNYEKNLTYFIFQ